MEFISGFVSIVGCPNVGKSTLINKIMRQKISIVSDKAQTTRNTVRGILTDETSQVVFLDTPGVQTPRNKLGEHMSKEVNTSLEEVDCILFIIDAKKGFGRRDKELLDRLRNNKTDIIVAVNKIDLLGKNELLKLIAELAEEGLEEIVPISAETGEGVGELLSSIKSKLKPGIMYYPIDMITDTPERMIAAELIREKALINLREEVPHGVGVEIEKIEYDPKTKITTVNALIYCESTSHKSIIIGKNGSMLKTIGTQARKELIKLFGTKIYLQIWVKVKKDWRNSESVIKTLGYE